MAFSGCYQTEEIKEQKRINDKIEEQLRKDGRAAGREAKVLLLGTDEFGKRALIQQMKALQGQGYTEDHRRPYKKLVFQNIFQDIQALCQAMDTLQIPYESPHMNEQFAGLVKAVNSKSVTCIDGEYTSYIKSLWEDKGIREAYERRSEFQLSDSAKYFLSNLDRIAAQDYIPNEEDLMRANLPYTGITEYRFNLDDFILSIIDVKGQRTERRKWIHYFENVASILFLVRLPEYDQFFCESDNENRMEESKALFKTIITYPWFQSSSVVLVFTDTDIFEEKIMSSDLKDYFPEYSGPKNDPKSAREFILKMFVDLNPDKEKMIYSYFASQSTTYEEFVRFLLSAVKDTIHHPGFNKYKTV